MNKNKSYTSDGRRIALIGECMIEMRPRGDGLCAMGYAGDTLNAALYMARLGMRPSYVTAIGADPYSDAMLAFWHGEDIGTDLVQRRPDRLPGLYMISTDGRGERQFHYWRNDAAVRTLFTRPEDERLLAALPGFPQIYWSGISLAVLPPEARGRLLATLATARQQGSRIVFDANFRARLWPDMGAARIAYEAAIAGADLVFTSLEDESPIFGDGDEEGLIARHRDAGVMETVVKNPRPGCRVRMHGNGQDFFVDAPAAPVVVDTTAAGDSFAAAYLAARTSGLAPDQAAQAGHRLAGAVVGVSGAILPRERMPDGLVEWAL